MAPADVVEVTQDSQRAYWCVAGRWPGRPVTDMIGRQHHLGVADAHGAGGRGGGHAGLAARLLVRGRARPGR